MLDSPSPQSLSRHPLGETPAPSLCRVLKKVVSLCDMARILAIDYGRKRTGLAVTDILQITPGGLGTVPTHQLMDFLADYLGREPVERIIVGHPRQMNYEESESMRYIRPFLGQLSRAFPNMPVELVDERFTSQLAQRTIREAGIGRIRRQSDKSLVDEVSAVILLQSYLASRESSGGIQLPDFLTTNSKKR